MKIVLTGSLGNIGKPLTKILVGHGHSVTVISSKADRQAEIEALGAGAAIGSVEDEDFVTRAFSGADAVYTMLPPSPNFRKPDFDLPAYAKQVGSNYARGIQAARIKRVVNLSSWGAHLEKGTGPIVGTHITEHILNHLPKEIGVTHIRPTSFYINLYSYVPMIKKTGLMASNSGGEDKWAVVSTEDIAVAVAEELEKIQGADQVRYVASDE